jgi:hypothetical protein
MLHVRYEKIIPRVIEWMCQPIDTYVPLSQESDHRKIRGSIYIFN